MEKSFRSAVFVLLVLGVVIAGSGCATHEPAGGSYPGSEQPSGTPSGKAPAHSKPYKIDGKTYRPIVSSKDFLQTGRASWYGKKFHGRKTANGETYDMYAMTAAHKTLPLGTWVRVDNLSNQKSAIVRVNDRGPFVTGRIIDLSYTAAEKLGVVGPGTAPVKVTALGRASQDPNLAKGPVTFTPVNYIDGNFTVQVGAFKDITNANRLKTKLEQRYANAHIVSYSDDRGLFYRVRVGKYTTLASAEDFEDQMLREGAQNAFAVAE
jgi:rare lipoprotein A